jgi:hypothetical protein
MRFAVFLFLVKLIFVSTLPAEADTPEQIECLKQIVPLHRDREKVAELDGIWGLFQKTSDFQNNSAQGLSLDNKINSILFHLEFLCTTLDGIPFDELSDYVSSGLAEKGVEAFKNELINMGKSEGEIGVWFEFSKFSIAHLHRPLDPNKVSDTIKSSQPFINQYLILAERINHQQDLGTVIESAKFLTQQIELFFKTDTYMSQAIYENSQIPYADFDENYGGS